MWTKVNIQPLSKEELREVINTVYPPLCTVTDRLLDIYFLLSAGKHEISDEGEDRQTSTAGKFLSNEGRLISTRSRKSFIKRVFNVKDLMFTDRDLSLYCCLGKERKHLYTTDQQDYIFDI